jgi:hypothetical protein
MHILRAYQAYCRFCESGHEINLECSQLRTRIKGYIVTLDESRAIFRQMRKQKGPRKATLF